MAKVKFRGDRLLKLAAFLEADAAANKQKIVFNMYDWGTSSPEGKIGLSCGTTGCALGTAAIAKLFPQLKYSVEPPMSWDPPGTPESLLPIIISRGGYKYMGTEAAMVLFGIDDDEATFLFMPDYYPSKYRAGVDAERYVAKRIRSFVDMKNKEKEINAAISAHNKLRCKLGLSGETGEWGV